jgi:hypothetical protein
VVEQAAGAVDAMQQLVEASPKSEASQTSAAQVASAAAASAVPVQAPAAKDVHKSGTAAQALSVVAARVLASQSASG